MFRGNGAVFGEEEELVVDVVEVEDEVETAGVEFASFDAAAVTEFALPDNATPLSGARSNGNQTSKPFSPYVHRVLPASVFN